MKGAIKKWIKRFVKNCFYLLRAIARKTVPVQWERWFVRRGYRCWRQICKQYGDQTHIFFLRGATGDVYLANLLLPEYLSEHGIDDYVLTGDAKGLKSISELYGVLNIAPITRWKASALQCFYKLCGAEATHITDLFMWQNTLYFNRCRIRMEERFTFMDTYQWYVFGFHTRKQLYPPRFPQPTKEQQKQWRKQGVVPGKTVIISPYAYSITTLSDSVWKDIAASLMDMGYQVLFCIVPRKERNPAPFCKSIFFSYRESVPLLEYAGGFLAVRSGLCDIVSSAKCKMVILYPMALKEKNYWKHRSDAAFCGLRAMGLNTEAEEISTPLLQNMEIKTKIETEKKSILQTELIDQIAQRFAGQKQMGENAEKGYRFS